MLKHQETSIRPVELTEIITKQLETTPITNKITIALAIKPTPPKIINQPQTIIKQTYHSKNGQHSQKPIIRNLN